MTRTMDEGRRVGLIYLGFANSFDLVNRRFLLAKMKSLGLSDVVVRWIEANLTGWVSVEDSGAIEPRDRLTIVSPFRFTTCQEPPKH